MHRLIGGPVGGRRGPLRGFDPWRRGPARLLRGPGRTASRCWQAGKHRLGRGLHRREPLQTGDLIIQPRQHRRQVDDAAGAPNGQMEDEESAPDDGASRSGGPSAHSELQMQRQTEREADNTHGQDDENLAGLPFRPASRGLLAALPTLCLAHGGPNPRLIRYVGEAFLLDRGSAMKVPEISPGFAATLCAPSGGVIFRAGCAARPSRVLPSARPSSGPTASPLSSLAAPRRWEPAQKPPAPACT